jgi:DNA-binding CsgD family transcriptional regulator
MLRLASLEKAQDASTIRRAVLSEYVRVTQSDYGLFHDTVHDGPNGPVVLGQVLVDGPERVRRHWKPLEGTSYTDLELGVEHISAMNAVTSVTQADLSNHWVDTVWKPADVHCAMRINSLDGEMFGGQIAGLRVSSRPLYGRCDVRAAQSFLPLALSALRMACRLSRTGDTVALKLFKPDGTPWMRSPVPFPASLLTPSLTEWIQQICRDKLSHACIFFDRYRLEAVSMSGSGERGVLVSAWPMLPLRVPRVLMLTPTQRQVASYAASGATVSEIAEHLDRSPDTVKSHLKTLYKELGVASRAELRGMVENFLTVPANGHATPTQ